MLDLTQMSETRLRELFWSYVSDIQRSRESSLDDTEADKLYGSARKSLTQIAELLGDEDDVLEMDGKPWHYYL